MKRIWITRAEPGASATATRLRTLGFEAVIAPLVATRPLPAVIDLSGIAALAFTSAAGVAAFAQGSIVRDLPAYAVGEASAQAAREAGFTEVISAAGDVAALARRIAADRAQIGGAVLHAGATTPAGDLTGDLATAGIPARLVAVYETVPVDPPEGLLDGPDAPDAVLLHSASAGRRLAEIVGAAGAPGLAALCISRSVAATLEGLVIGPISVAALPDEDALLSLLAG